MRAARRRPTSGRDGRRAPRARARPRGRRRPRPAARRRTRARRRACRVPAGPWNRYACERPPSSGRARGRRRRADGARGRRAATARSLRLDASPATCVRGRLITVEGIDGAGKTTLAAGLARARSGATRVLREPGGVELVRAHPRARQGPGAAVDPRAEALLYAAARAQLVAEQLRPRWPRARLVLLDRFVDSSLAYQGGGPRARRRGGARAQRVRHRRPGARPHAAAAHRPGGRAARAGGRGEAPTGSSARTLALLRRDRRRLRRAGGGRAGALRRARRRRSRPSAVLADAARRPRFSPRSRPGGPGARPRRRRSSSSSSGLRGSQPSTSRTCADAATSSGGSPGRRPSSTAGISRPVTRRAASITSRTLKPVAVAEVVDRVHARLDRVERQHVRVGEVLDVDVVAHRGAVAASGSRCRRS